MKRTKYQIDLIVDIIHGKLTEEREKQIKASEKEINKILKKEGYENYLTNLAEIDKQLEELRNQIDELRDNRREVEKELRGKMGNNKYVHYDSGTENLKNKIIDKIANENLKVLKVPQPKEIEKEVFLSDDIGSEVIIKKLTEKFSK